ncbi:MAG: hypothetical protein ACUVQK_08570, partial [Thermogutta sp.]
MTETVPERASKGGLAAASRGEDIAAIISMGKEIGRVLLSADFSQGIHSLHAANFPLAAFLSLPISPF